MNVPHQRDQSEALILRIKAESGEELDRIRAEAQAQAAEIVKTAHRRARQRVHVEIKALRREWSQALRHETARLDTERRQLRQREARTEIQSGWPALETAFAELWASEETRMAWARAALKLAAQRLRHGVWTIEHPPGWGAKEMQLLGAEVEALAGSMPEFEVDRSLTAGLRIHAGQAWLDACPATLMADRESIGAALLAEISRGNGDPA